MPGKGKQALNSIDTVSSSTATTCIGGVIDAGNSNQICDMSPLSDHAVFKKS